MPYIKKKYRDEFDPKLENIMKYVTSDGELCYCIYKMALIFLERKLEINYSALASILGILDSAHKEFYRRKVAPYEDKKIEENGDI